MQTDKRMSAVGGEDPRSVAARDAEIDRLLQRHYAQDVEAGRLAAAARRAGCVGDDEDPGAFGSGLAALLFGVVYGVVVGIVGTLAAQYAWTRLAAWWAGAQ